MLCVMCSSASVKHSYIWHGKHNFFINNNLYWQYVKSSNFA